MNINIENITYSELKNPRFIKPIRINYTQNSVNKTWEAVKSFDSVSVLLYHKTKDALLVVKQFRPAVYMNSNQHKFTYELCAGIIDKDLSLEQIVKEEILEECGFDVDVKNITKITSSFTHVGVSGARQYMYFTTIDDSMKVNDGGGIGDEFINLEYIPVSKVKELIFDETKARTPGLMFAFYWFLDFRMKN